MCQRIKAMNYSGSKYYIDFYDVIPSGDKYRRALKLENEILDITIDLCNWLIAL